MALTQITIQNSDLGMVISRLVNRNYYAYASTHVADSTNGYLGVVNDNYQGDAAKGIVQIGIQKMKRFDAASRTLGAVSNGDFISTTAAKTITNTTLALPLTQVFDPVINVPELQQGYLMFSAAEQIAYNISGDLTREIDTYTAKVMYDAAATFGATLDTPYSNFVKTDGTTLGTGDAKTALITTSEKLTNLPDNDYDWTTPPDNRAVIARVEFINNLRESGISVTGSEYAFKTYVKGIEGYDISSLGDEIVVNRNFMGSYVGFNTFQMLDSFFPEPAVAGKVFAIATHFLATTRAMHTFESKIVPTVTYMGWAFQYLVTYGALAVKPWMIVPIVSSDWAEVESGESV